MFVSVSNNNIYTILYALFRAMVSFTKLEVLIKRIVC